MYPLLLYAKTKKNSICTDAVRNISFGVPGRIRTCDRRLRRALLYPAELLRHYMFCRFSRQDLY